MRKTTVVIIGLILGSYAMALCVFPFLPDTIATHWNIRGEADGTMSKFWGLFLLPLILTVTTLMLIFIPRIDPLRKNIESFRPYYDGFIIAFCLFMILIEAFVIVWNIGMRINTNGLMSVGIGALFFITGILCEKSERNWFIGIRTPWTLSDDTVWAKTHRVGGILFKVSGIISFTGFFFPRYMVFFILVPSIGSALISTIYSYFVYRKMTMTR